jgi:hypothetical protein
LGAIELLSTQGALSTIDTGATGIGAIGETETDPWEVLGGSGVEDESFDLVVMNPPFTRLTGGGGKTTDVPLPMFSAFGTEAEEQELMSDLFDWSSSNRHRAGLARKPNRRRGSAHCRSNPGRGQ